MINNLILLCLILIAGCGSNGIEGYVSEPISITAKQPEDGIDYDYFWVLSDQPDGSLMSSNDLISTNDGNKMTFIPDYPGDYSIEVVISEYGDEISNQIFNFYILDFKEKKISEDINNTVNSVDEKWLNEEIEDPEIEDPEIEDPKVENLEIEDPKVENPEIEDPKVENPEVESDENYNKTVEKSDLNTNIRDKTTVNKKAKVLNKRKVISRNSNIAERTDRFTIQIASKKMLKDAQIFSQELIKKGYDAYIQKVVFKSNETFYRVRIGSYDSQNSAKIAANALSKDLGITAWVDFVRKDQ